MLLRKLYFCYILLTIIASYKTPVDTRSEHVEKAVTPTLHCEVRRLP